jgi:hypothetical protein
LGRVFDGAVECAIESIPDQYRLFIEVYSASDNEEEIYGAVAACTNPAFLDSSYKGIVILRLKDKAAQYQTMLLVPLEKLTLPLLIFSNNDSFNEPFMSRIQTDKDHVFKQPNGSLQVAAFVPPNKLLSKTTVGLGYECPALIKLGNYDRLPVTSKKLDTLISKLSGGMVYPEVLSGVPQPIQAFSDEVQIEALSLLKERLNSEVGI